MAQGTVVDSSSLTLHAGSAFERGTRVACDPRDTVAEGRMPKLTIMEQVLLLGLKDKQVGVQHPCHPHQSYLTTQGLFILLE